VSVNFVNDDFFTSMGIPIERGRGFTSEDRRLLTAADPDVADPGVDTTPTLPRTLIVDRQLVDDLFPDRDALDARLRFDDFEDWRIVGIAAPIRQRALDHPPMPTIYLHQGHSPYSTSLIVRTAVPPSSLSETVREAVLAVDPDQPITNVRTFDEALTASLANRRTTLILLTIFALVAVALACLGIYGVMSYAVGQRHRELCIRSALGADRRAIRGLVLRSGLGTSMLGIAIGVAAAWMLASLLERLLYQVDAHDPIVFAASIGLLVMVATLSIVWPARRAARADPSQALRSE
ncbi:MAG: FtsX-like permease family protein, partial [Acidobacteriota bacterium]